MKPLCQLAWVVLLLSFLPVAVKADTLSYTRTGTIYLDDADPEAFAEYLVTSVPKFGPSSGQLTGVTMEVAADFSGGYTFTNDIGGAAGQVEYVPHARVWAEHRLPSRTRVEMHAILPAQYQSFATGVGGTAQDTAAGMGANSLVLSPVEVAEFVGTGAAVIDVEIADQSIYRNDSITPDAGVFSKMITADVTFTLTYTYTPPAPTAGVLYVDADATAGANDGSSWADAFTDLQSAIAIANPGNEIWVAEGEYHPAGPGGDRAATFSMEGGVSWYGGFAGTESDRAARDPAAHPTILSGDLNDDDGGGTGVNASWYHMGENSYHVVSAANLLTPASIDGFTIARGWAWQSSGGNSGGSGMTTQYCTDLRIANCRFEGNLAHSGAGLLNIASITVIEDCTFHNNLASDGRGGAIYHTADWQDYATTYLLSISGSSFTHNTATVGGGPGDAGAIWASFRSPIHVDDCLFENNQAKWRFTYGSTAAGGGAMLIFGEGSRITNSVFRSNRAHVGGALWVGRNVTIANCLFVDNEAFRQSVGYYDYGGYAGAIYAPGTGTNNTAVIDHCTFHANTARNVGGVWGNPGLTIVNSILWTNTSTEAEATLLDQQLTGDPIIRHSCVRGLPDPGDGNNITGNPVFVDQDGPDNLLGNADDDLRLSDGSPGIDAGENAAFPAWAAPFDFAGNDRFIDDPATIDTGIGVPPITDMGAYEFVPGPGSGPPGPNVKPVASFTYSVVDNTVTFTDTSTDSDGTIVEWIWDFGDGTTSTAPNPVHEYLANGAFNVTLTVRDNDNGTNRSAVHPVTVSGLVTGSVTVAAPAHGATVSGSVAVTANATPDIVRVKLYVDGVYTELKDETPSAAPAPAFSIDWDSTTVADGTHVIEWKANDATDSDEGVFWSPPVTVIVNNALPPTPVESWRATHFAAVDLNDPTKEATLWGGSADPDSDGLNNDGEMGLGTNPHDPTDGDGGVTHALVEEDGHRLLTMTFRRRNDDPGLEVTAKLSESMAAWTASVSMLRETSSVDQGNGYDLVTVKEVPAATPRTQCFGRVFVTRLIP